MVRTFPKEDDQISIAGEIFNLSALPSAKALKLQNLLGEVDLQKALQDVSKGLSEDMPVNEELAIIFSNLANKVRYDIISYALDIPKDSEDYSRLTKAIDEAGFKEIWWIVEQIIDINGFRFVEKMVKNLVEMVKPALPELGTTASRLVKKYLEKEELQTLLDDKIKDIRSRGSTSSSSDLPENHSTLPQPSLVTS